MERKITITYHIVLTLAMILTIVIFIMTNNTNSVTSASQAIVLNDQLQSESVGTCLTYSGTLPQSDMGNSVLCFYSSHATVEVSVDGQIIYSLVPENDALTKTTGYVWNEITLSEKYAGKSVVITLHSIYGKKVGSTSIYYGHPSAVVQKLFKEELDTILESLIIFLVGIILLFYAIMNGATKKKDFPSMNLSIFALLLALWTISDCHFTVFLFPGHVGLVFLTHLTLMLMGTPFILFLKSTFQDDKHIVWYIYAFFNIFICIVRIVLQLTGILDLRETLTLTHISIFVLVGVILYEIVHELIHNRLTASMKFNFFTCFIIIAPAVADVVYYQIFQRQGSLGRLGFLAYILIVSASNIKTSQESMERVKENEIYRKLAFIDELTGLFNRTAYQRDMENLQNRLSDNSSEKLDVSILMFDLNDLKKCNDTYGHDYGDSYISMVAREIRKSFESKGRCFRIGGDEFCVIIESLGEKAVENAIDLFHRNIQKLNEHPFVVPISVAVGSASYDTNVDASLGDTRSRADSIMYAEKKRMKAKLNVG